MSDSFWLSLNTVQSTSAYFDFPLNYVFKKYKYKSNRDNVTLTQQSAAREGCDFYNSQQPMISPAHALLDVKGHKLWYSSQSNPAREESQILIFPCK